MFLLSPDNYEIKETKKKGKGVFAKKNIRSGVILGDYIGTVIKTAEDFLPDDKESFYLLYYHDQASIFPDLKKPGIHLLNHSCAPNCWMYTYRGHTLFFSLRNIFKGEEITISYLLSPQEPYCKNCTHLCSCGHLFCTKSFHLSQKRYASWSAFHEKQSQETKRMRIHYGKVLPKLSTYPKRIPDNPIYTLFGAEHIDPFILQNTSLPSISEIRRTIRQTGKTLYLPFLNIKIHGILENKIISNPYS
ncbi:MAG: SET domain-containing protein [Candidatus Levybacteria bacterium]|nr:SET domain-containing protein [Candidatus Levybacteria bacterium]